MSLAPPRAMILASASPARQRLLSDAGIVFSVVVSDIDESPVAGESIPQRARRLAKEKAQRIARARPDALVIGADQVGFIPSQQRELMKCATRVQARKQLRAMSNATHVFIATAAVLHGTRVVGEVEEKAAVRFIPLEHDVIEAYLDTEQWRGTCGAYRFEGDAQSFVRSFDGSSAAILGLPLRALLALLRSETGSHRSSHASGG